MTSRRSRILIAAAALALGQSAGAGSGAAPSISMSPIRTVAAPGGAPGMVREFTVTLQKAGGGPVQSYVVQGPYKALDADEEPRARVVGDRLLVLTDAVIAVFDLGSGEQVLDLVGAPGVTVTGDGRRVAFETSQTPFTPPEASSSVIQVVDVPSLAVEPVFPERSAVEPSQLGTPMTWIEDPAERHSAGQLVFSPDGLRLAFFCTHGGLEAGEAAEVYLTVVDLPDDLARSRFIHQAFDWKAHLLPRVAAGERRLYFAVESVVWTEEDALVVRAAPSAHWLEREFTVPVPERGAWKAKPEPDGKEDGP